MAEESSSVSEAPPGPSPDPVLGLAKAVRPVNIVLGLGLVYLVGAAAAGTGLIALAWRDASEGILAWAILGGVLGIPLTGLLAWAGVRSERVLTGQVPPARWLWVPFAWGVAMSAHWAPLCPWPVALWGAAVLQSSRADRYIGESLSGLIAWGGVLVGLGVLVPVSRALVRRRWTGHAARPGGRELIPTSLLVGGVYLLGVTPPTALWIGWLQDTGWNGGSGGAAIVAWALLGAGCAAAAGAGYGAWLGRAGASVPDLTADHDARRSEVAGVVAAAHWMPTFVVAVSPALRHQPDLRFALLCCTFALILAGTAAWSGSRSVRAARRTLAVS